MYVPNDLYPIVRCAHGTIQPASSSPDKYVYNPAKCIRMIINCNATAHCRRRCRIHTFTHDIDAHKHWHRHTRHLYIPHYILLAVCCSMVVHRARCACKMQIEYERWSFAMARWHTSQTHIWAHTHTHSNTHINTEFAHWRVVRELHSRNMRIGETIWITDEHIKHTCIYCACSSSMLLNYESRQWQWRCAIARSTIIHAFMVIMVTHVYAQ